MARGESPKPENDPALDAPADLRGLFSGLEILRRPDGGVTFQADPSTALALEQVFAGMAELMRTMAQSRS